MKKFGKPSWQRLVEVVGDPAGGANPALASQIAEKHRAKQTTGTVHIGDIHFQCVGQVCLVDLARLRNLLMCSINISYC